MISDQFSNVHIFRSKKVVALAVFNEEADIILEMDVGSARILAEHILHACDRLESEQGRTDRA